MMDAKSESTINIASRSLTGDQVDAARRLVRNDFYHGTKPLSGESPKTTEDTALIDNINTTFKAKFDELGVGNIFEPLKLSSVHFLPNRAFKRLFPDAPVPVLSKSLFRFIAINNDEVKIDSKVFVSLHEAAHMFSYSSFRYTPGWGENETTDRQSGFKIRTKSKLIGEAFVGLNEAVCDKIAQEIQEENMELFFGPGATIENTNPQIGSYLAYREIFHAIVDGIARANVESQVDVSRRFYRAFFTGDVDPLKEVESVFGSGSLRKLAMLGGENKPGISNENKVKARDEAREYFQRPVLVR